TSCLISSTSERMLGFSRPSAMMSKDCSSGTPAFIMVAICRVKMAMSMGLIFLPAPNRATDFLRTLSGLMPCLRSCALIRAGFCPFISPLSLPPRLSVPSQAKVLVFIAFVAMVLVLGHAVDFFQAGHALDHLEQAGAAQVVEAVPAHLCGDVDGVAVFHDNPLQRGRVFNHFINTDTAFIAVLAVFAA